MTGSVGSPGGSALRSRTIAGWVKSLGQSDEARFLHPKLAHLTPPDQMADRSVAASRIVRALRKGQRIAVFGDYDCDGMTASAILCDVLEELGAEVRSFLASRFDGGYGFSEPALGRVLSYEPQLLITCDCGSSDHATLRKASEAGVDVIVIDHHLVPDEPLPALAFLNPHRPDCGFAYKGLASCGLVLSVAAELRKQTGAQLDVRRWLDLVAIGTIADVAPLCGDNRALVRAGLAAIQKSPQPGIRALCDLVGIDRAYPVTAQDVAFRLAPRLNAPGRLQAPDLAFQLLREKDPERARDLATEVEQLCQLRRATQAKIEKEATLEVVERGQDRTAAIVVGREGWNHGIVGIVAGRLSETHEKPAVVIGFHEGLGMGSVRGPDGFPLFDCLSECADHLVRFGGHQAAAGLTVAPEQLDAFRESFESACARRKDFQAPAPQAALRVQPEDNLRAVLADLYLLEPCGERNPAPLLEFPCQVLRTRELKGGHLKLEMQLPGGRRVSGFGPGLFERFGSVTGPARVVGQLRQDTYRGGEAVEILVSRVVCDPSPG